MKDLRDQNTTLAEDVGALSGQVQGLQNQLVRWSKAVTEITNSIKANHISDDSSTPEPQADLLVDDDVQLRDKNLNIFTSAPSSDKGQLTGSVIIDAEKLKKNGILHYEGNKREAFSDWASKFELITGDMGYNDETRAKALYRLLTKKAYEVWKNVKRDWKKIKEYMTTQFPKDEPTVNVALAEFRAIRQKSEEPVREVALRI